MHDRDAYVEKMKAKLDEWNQDIDRLEAQAEGAKAEAKARFQHQLDELKAMREETIERMHAWQSASADAWETMRHGAEAAWQDMAKAFQEAANRFK